MRRAPSSSVSHRSRSAIISEEEEHGNEDDQKDEEVDPDLGVRMDGVLIDSIAEHVLSRNSNSNEHVYDERLQKVE